MAAIEDPGVSVRIAQEFHKVNKQKTFGLGFEEHFPEATPLYDIPIKRGALVAEKQGKISDGQYGSTGGGFKGSNKR